VDRPAPLILLIEDEPQMRRFLRTALDANDYRLVEAETAKDGLAQAAARNPDVILLDLGLPDRDGLEVARELRGWSTTPIVVLSARGREEDKVRALDLGADDYLTKPFGVEELLARIRVALRHAALPPGAGPGPVFEAGDLRVDLAARRVSRAGQEVHLTPTEYKLLITLVRHAGKVLTHRQLLKDVWGANYVNQSHYVRVYMGQLRQKIEADPARPRLLLTEPGVGYRLRDQ
jgi:two-component system, OmpR family, KDP operon response regulator KdpE